ncbi:MAG: branched-chain amino acid ABC transporter ATP-binding protein, partial [Deltaproteobacteria bacterium]|nr:branched-chain amino acid ABC transporter ATP-binding protein [Deltaproteobacteria bacterium]
MLAIARGLMSRPSLLLLDEPTMGLAPVIAQDIYRQVIYLNKEQGLAILIVEQNARIALGLAERGYIIETGRIVLEGNCRELKQSNEIKRAYLGKDYREVWE